MKRYKVHVEFATTRAIELDAKDEEEAKRRALLAAESPDADVDEGENWNIKDEGEDTTFSDYKVFHVEEK